ncbi:hypothetical protein [Pedobacter jamesrossensis]|uniref:PH domain-containing protein n=1 Tax=Pedobacter jamesrossensis TaxID=1908238 RepID=A0ABV8NIP4_9SPHI
MQNFNLNYHKNSILLTSMVAVPLIIAGSALMVLLSLPLGLSEFVYITIIAISFIFMITFLRWLINNFIIVPCKATISQEGIFFSLKKRSFLYKTNEFFSAWENVSSISEIFCSKTGRNFHRITFINPKITANFSAIKYTESDADKFFNDLNYYKETFLADNSKIRTNNFQNWIVYE